jgi:hypothetical protein
MNPRINPFDGWSVCGTTRSLAPVILWFVLGVIPILSALRSVCLCASLPLFPVILLRRSKLSSTTFGMSRGADIDREVVQKSTANAISAHTYRCHSNCKLRHAILDISLRALLPLFFSTPTSLGGLGFAPTSIGLWLALWSEASTDRVSDVHRARHASVSYNGVACAREGDSNRLG